MAPKPKCSAGSRKTIRWFCSSWNPFPFCHSEPHGGALTRRGRARNLLLKAFQESQKIAPFLKRRTGRSYVHVTPHALCPSRRSVRYCVVIRSFGPEIGRASCRERVGTSVGG